jgi:hypothetical protein
MASITPNVTLYTQHITEAGQCRSVLTALKALVDGGTFRQNLISLNSIEANLTNLPYPDELVGRVNALSVAIQELETTLGIIENGIRGALLYPRQ